MPLVFTNPALLLGALAGAIPIIIHFLSRRKVQRQKFSDLRFLNEVQARQARSLGVRRWLLLLLRVLAILLMVLAVAGPRWGGLGLGTGSQTSVLFVIDTSASMNTQSDAGTRLEEALAACAELSQSLPEHSSVQVITSGSTTASLFGDWLPSGPAIIQSLGLIRQTDGKFDAAAVMREAALQVVRAPSSQVQMIWLSDLQVFPQTDEMALTAAALLEAGQVNHLLRRVGHPASGGAVLSVSLPQRSIHQGENVTVNALVTSQFDDQAFVLELDGRPVAEAVATRASIDPISLAFTMPVPGPGLHTGTIRKESDVMPADDSRPFVLEVPEALDVLIVHGKDRSIDATAGRGGWRYLLQALSPGGANPLIRVRHLESSMLTTGDLTRAQVVYFVDPDPLGRRMTDSTLDWVRGGGAACFILGESTQANYLAGSLLPALGWTGSLNFQGGDSRQPQEQRAHIIDSTHPVFAGLEAEALATVEDIVWHRWFRIQDVGSRVLLSLADDSPLVLERDLEAGQVVLLPFNLKIHTSNLVTSPMALPFFQRMSFWLAGHGNLGSAVNLEVGQRAQVYPRVDPASGLLERTDELKIHTGSPALVSPASLVWLGNRPQLVGNIIENSGFSAFVVSGDTVGLVAAAVPVEESNLNLLSTEQFESILSRWGLPLWAEIPSEGMGDLSPLLAGRSLAPWFFFMAIVILLVELYVGRGTSAA